MLVRTEQAVIYSRLVEGRFPRYQDVFPTHVEVKIPLEAGPLRQAVEQASIVTSEESRGVDFQFGAGALKLASQAADVGSSHVELPIAYEGKTDRDHLRPPLPDRRPEDPRRQRHRHRRADRLQERRRLQDRGSLHLRRDAPDPRPLSVRCQVGRSLPGGLDRDRPSKNQGLRFRDRIVVLESRAGWPGGSIVYHERTFTQRVCKPRG